MKNIIKNTLLAFLLISPEVLASDTTSYCKQLEDPNEVGECIENKASPEVVRLLVASRTLKDSVMGLERAIEEHR